MDRDTATDLNRRLGDDVMALFAALWAAASLFHVLGPSGRARGVVDDLTASGVVHVLIGVTALVVLCRPRWRTPLAVLAALGIVSAVQEAPILGNHWYVAALVDIGLLASMAASLRGWRVDGERLGVLFPPLARWTLVVFYSFAAFAKMNTAFFDTTVSCSTFFFDETAHSLGFSTPLAVGHGGWASVIPVTVVAIETAVPVFLLIRPTRNGGVVLGLLFHSAIALDQTHLFSDFSSMLSALFVLFLPVAFAGDALRFVKERLRGAVAVWIALAAVVLLAEWTARAGLAESVRLDGRMWLWFTFDAAVVIGVIAWLVPHRADVLVRPLALGTRARWLALVPALVALSGLLPYVELRNVYSYTMYSNLRILDGDSNHALVRASVPVGHRQADIVRILATSDPGLSLYSRLRYDLAWNSFRSYMSRHPQASVTYERAGQVHTLAHASDDPAVVTAASIIDQKVLPLRAIDEQDPPRCQDSFLPAS